MSVRLPNFVVVGAPKCGTTSLYHYLRQHPDVFVPERKELHYFSYPYMRQFIAGPGDEYQLTTLCKTEGEYAGYYAGAGTRAAIGDVSPSYFYYADLPGSDLCERMRGLLGDVRIILMIRDPVQKAFSQFMHLVRDARETLDFERALAAEAERTRKGYSAIWRYAGSSLFTNRTQTFMDAFGSVRVKPVFFDEFSARPRETMSEIFAFLGVDPDAAIDVESTYNRSGLPRSRLVAGLFANSNPVTALARRMLPLSVTTRIRDVLQRLNTGAKPTLDAASRRFLEGYFEDDLQALAKLLGRRATSAATGSDRRTS
jgi:hypothetical protein